ncbi:Tn3 family transposase [Amycolatopsis sp. DG1A-15b]|nr:Tn3 family transposase [Amycolatopsis sp. DG1A-15b]WIX93404.1 Tn3 family transposase [Amycolatopsis sp. DG1A-15b]
MTSAAPAAAVLAAVAQDSPEAPVPVTADEAQAEQQLREALLGLEPLLERRDGPVRVSDQGALVISKLTAEEVPDEVETVRMGLVELLPRLPITELLIEVDRWTGFSDKLTHAGGKSTRDDALLAQLYAAVLAQACNFGITAMAESTGLTYDKLAWTTQWYLRGHAARGWGVGGELPPHVADGRGVGWRHDVLFGRSAVSDEGQVVDRAGDEPLFRQ